LQVRYADTDQMGVVHNSVYSAYCEIGRTNLCEAAGVPYHQLEADGYWLMVAQHEGRFLKPIRYGQETWVLTRLQRVSASLITFAYELHTANDPGAHYRGSTTHVVTTPQARTTRLPDSVLALLRALLPKS
jgi:acyl-CoA thioester hydrolase